MHRIYTTQLLLGWKEIEPHNCTLLCFYTRPLAPPRFSKAGTVTSSSDTLQHQAHTKGSINVFLAPPGSQEASTSSKTIQDLGGRAPCHLQGNQTRSRECPRMRTVALPSRNLKKNATRKKICQKPRAHVWFHQHPGLLRLLPASPPSRRL